MWNLLVIENFEKFRENYEIIFKVKIYIFIKVNSTTTNNIIRKGQQYYSIGNNFNLILKKNSFFTQ